MKNKKSPSTAQKLIFRERIFITLLVMAVMAVFILVVGFLVPFFQMRNLSSNANTKINEAVIQCVNATYGYGSNDSLLEKERQDTFVIITDNDGKHVFPEKKSDEILEKWNTVFANVSIKQNSSAVFQEDGFFYAAMDSDYVENNLAIEKSQEIITKPIDVPDEALIYVGIDYQTDVSSLSSFSWILSTVLLIGFLLMIPLVYVISGRVMKPTKDTIRHEKEFVANASHELKTPLAIITADAEILAEKNPENSEYVNNIIAQCQNMNETVLDMIALSKLEVGVKKLETVDFSQLLLDLAMSFDAIAYEREIDYAYDIQSGLVLKEADKKNLTRLINLLIDNAMKYTKGAKIIRISLKMVKKDIVFEVYNTGCEVLDADREKVFERFYQGKSGADNERIGSGLGLAIVKQICDNYKYPLAIESSYHKYMKFSIVLR